LPVGPELVPGLGPGLQLELVPVAEAVSWLAEKQAAEPVVFSHIQRKLR